MTARRAGARRGAYWHCLAAGALAVLLALAGSVLWWAGDAQLLARGVIENTDLPALGMDEREALRFADETLAYLRGDTETWVSVAWLAELNPELVVSPSFAAHMATVRGWGRPFLLCLLAGAALALALLVMGLRRGLSLQSYWLGAGLALALILGLVAWAALDFSSFWMTLHRLLIPDGIFPAGEPIMRLFPLGLFMGYLAPVALTFAALTLVLLAVPPLLRHMMRPKSSVKKAS